VRILVLATDAFGGRGGIARYTRDVVTALVEDHEVGHIDLMVRNEPESPGPLPAKVRLFVEKSTVRFVVRAAAIAVWGRPNRIICSHANLLPAAALARFLSRAPLILWVYGVDVWQPLKQHWSRILLPRVDRLVSISRVTLEKLRAWCHLADLPTSILPNGICLAEYGTAAKRSDLVKHYGTAGRTVLMTLGRISAAERYKGFDEVIEVLEELTARGIRPLYIVAGSGDDVLRLKDKVKNLGLNDRVHFTGFIEEHAKLDLLRLADVYVMPSYGEGFGYVLLEALACGIPVVASRADGGFEAVREGTLAECVDPNARDEIIAAIVRALSRPRDVPDGLDIFEIGPFKTKTRQLVRDTSRR
jgi:glycosyltransferase involved in cell wall biosynthesis